MDRAVAFDIAWRVLLCVAAFLFALVPHQASARDNLSGLKACHLSADLFAPVGQQFARWNRWQCNRGPVDLEQGRNLIRFEAAQFDKNAPPRFLVSRVSKFTRLSVALVVDGRIVEQAHNFGDIHATFFDRQFIVPLPASETAPEAILVAVDGATQQGLIEHAHLVDIQPGLSPQDRNRLMLIAVFLGMMVMPLIFDIAFYRVLQQSFIAWHALLVVSMALHLLCVSGLYLPLYSAPLPMLRIFTVGSFNLMAIAATMFTVSFIEREKLPDRMRRVALWSAVGFSCISVVHMLGFEALGRLPANLYFASGLPLSALFVLILWIAFKRGSTAAHYLVIGLSPLLLVALIRVVSFVVPGLPSLDANELFFIGTLVEASATALGVANRFLALKLERDRAHAERDVMEDLAERDTLTGLLNRRAIQRRFSDLRKQGFSTMALLDLDRFKDINDRFGHQTGDDVLRACAAAINRPEDRDSIAVRLGGEEFVLLVRGPGAVPRIEAFRQAIPRYIANAVCGLDRPVTASMGVIEIPARGLAGMEFTQLYARADKLLYEAKETGRNRAVYERLTLFEAGPASEVRRTGKRARRRSRA